MIVAPDQDRLRVVTQNDHAHFAAELLSLWRHGLGRHGDLPTNPRRAEILLATREHDNGWREADSAPRVDPATGRPHDFLTMPRAVRAEIWLRGTARLTGRRTGHHLERDPYAALLITHHALYLHRDRRDDPDFAELLNALTERHDELLEASGAAPETVSADYAFLDLADLLSLVACNRWRDPFERRGVRGRFEGEALTLDPFPLAGSTSFRLPYRVIPDRRYSGDGDLAIELARARWQEATVRVRPWVPEPTPPG